MEAAGVTLGDLYYPLPAAYQVVLAVLILMSGRRSSVRAGFAVVLVISAIQTLDALARLHGATLLLFLGVGPPASPNVWPDMWASVLYDLWISLADTLLLATTAFLLTQFPVRPGGRLRALGDPRVWLAGVGMWLAAFVVLRSFLHPTWSWVFYNGHEALFAVMAAILALHTVPQLLRLGPGPLRLQTSLVVAGIGLPLFEIVTIGSLRLSTGFPAGYPLVTQGLPTMLAFHGVALLFVLSASLVLAMNVARARGGERAHIALLGGQLLALALGVVAGAERRVPAELLAQAFRPLLLGIAVLRFDLFQAPDALRRPLLAATAALLGLSMFVMAHGTITGTGLGATALDPGVVLVSMTLFAVAIYVYREPLGAFFLPPPHELERAQRRERLQRYQLAFDQARNAPHGDDEAGLAALRTTLGISRSEHDAIASVLEGRIVIPQAALLGAAAGDLVQGRYRVVRELGRGGQGRVLLAHDARHDGEVVLKEVLRPWEEAAAPRRAALAREARSLARVRSPHVAGVLGVVEDAWQQYLVRDFVPGESLADAVEARGPLVAEDARRVMGDVLQGLEALHREGVLHLDLKPHNVILRPDGRAVLIDVSADGGPVQAGETDVTRAMEDSGALLTLRWAAPEQLRDRKVAVRTDVWQAGGLLFFLLTGRPPVPGETAFEVERGIVEGAPLPWPGKADPGLRRVAEQARAHAAAERFATAKAMRLALDGHAPGPGPRKGSRAEAGPNAARGAGGLRQGAGRPKPPES